MAERVARERARARLVMAPAAASRSRSAPAAPSSAATSRSRARRPRPSRVRSTWPPWSAPPERRGPRPDAGRGARTRSRSTTARTTRRGRPRAGGGARPRSSATARWSRDRDPRRQGRDRDAVRAAPLFERVVFTRALNPRSLSPGTLEASPSQLGGPPAETVADPRAAVELAQELAGAGGRGARHRIDLPDRRPRPGAGRGPGLDAVNDEGTQLPAHDRAGRRRGGHRDPGVLRDRLPASGRIFL